jgi:hypothetical protein
VAVDRLRKNAIQGSAEAPVAGRNAPDSWQDDGTGHRLAHRIATDVCGTTGPMAGHLQLYHGHAA